MSALTDRNWQVREMQDTILKHIETLTPTDNILATTTMRSTSPQHPVYNWKIIDCH
ncbi:MAG: hypothetical protein L7W43_07395 [Rubripirellula sp.]|nr:hypothetical protein [Rubripirellula sp.]